MKVELVFNNVTTPMPLIPSVWKQPKPGQMLGTAWEQLVELAGRGCYDSLGTGRDSKEYHQHLIESKHYSVHEHVHVTIETDLPACVWHGIPDYSLIRAVSGRTRITLNLRHILEWPNNVIYSDQRSDSVELVNRWGNLLAEVGHYLMPNALPKPQCSGESWDHMVPEYDTEKFVSLFLEDSRVWCFTEDTEVFTSKGWIPVQALSKTDDLLTLDPKTQKARWSPVLQMNSFGYDGKLYWWESSQMQSPKMTEDHLVWCSPYSEDSRVLRGMTTRETLDLRVSKVPCSELYNKRFVIDHRIRFAEVSNPEVVNIGAYSYPAAELFSWLGWIATDGYLSGSGKCIIYQSKTQHLPRIRRLMTDLFGDRWKEYGPYREGDSTQFLVHDQELLEFTKNLIGPNKTERFFSPELFSFHRRLLRRFFWAAMQGDGSVHKKNGHEVLYCPSEAAAGQWQVLGAMLGRCANVRKDDRTGVPHSILGQETAATRPCYQVSFSRKDTSIIHKRFHRSEDFSGRVWCPTTADGVIYVRRKGLAFWCGNSHEQVRHRHNMSQRSGRFVDETDRKDCIHPLFREYLNEAGYMALDPDDGDTLWSRPKEGCTPGDISDRTKLGNLIGSQLTQAKFNYEAVVHHLQPWLEKKKGLDKPTARKQARSAARYYLLNALSTEMIFTASLRNWSAIFAKRCNPAADAAIFEVMTEARKVVEDSTADGFRQI